MVSLNLIALVSGALLVSAGPLVRKDEDCDTSNAGINLPANQTALVAPATAPLFILLGVGIPKLHLLWHYLRVRLMLLLREGARLNIPSSIGAVASLFDISCLYPEEFETVQTTAFNIWENAYPRRARHRHRGSRRCSQPGRVPLLCDLPLRHRHLAQMGLHLRKIRRERQRVRPRRQTGDILAPTDHATNIDWLQLTAVQGELASGIFRVDTVGGQPPTSCVAGDAPVSVKYTSKYYLY
ncbi:hypothetical protein B0H14DRAFT_3729796 [Mycena olivaceomarginata]|nr:hypothetical protein B0H14DRAFT_3729796 [Mycena olivaceomarginata]